MAEGPKKQKAQVKKRGKKESEQSRGSVVENFKNESYDEEIEDMERTIDILHQKLEKLAKLMSIKDKKIELLENKLFEYGVH